MTAHVAFADREARLRDGAAWADVDGVWHDGAPDTDIIAAAITAHASDPRVHTAHLVALDTAREVGRLWRLLDVAVGAERAAHRQVHIEALACMSRANLAPHDAANDARINKYFADRADST